MPNISHLYKHFKKYGLKNQPLYLVSLMIFFWVLFDGIISFISPLVITEMGLSETMMGIIIGSSSVAGALFDFILCRILSNTNFRRIYLFMLAISCFYPLILWQAKTIWIYLIAMALWGLYYDFYHIATFDFVSREIEDEHSSGFGVLSAFSSLGYLIAPIIAGLLIGTTVNFKPFIMAWIFLSIAIVFYLLVVLLTAKNNRHVQQACYHPLNFMKEYRLWKKIGKLIFPILFLTFILNINDAFFWTIGPLLSEELSEMHGLGSLFMVAYTLPALIVGWFIGGITKKFGQKKTAFYSLFLGSLILSTLFLVKEPIILIAINFIASFFISLAWPAINGAYSDYISETPHLGKEIETLQDSFANIGYVVGPIAAGFLGDHLGHTATFSILGLVGAITAFALLKVTPSKINIKFARR